MTAIMYLRGQNGTEHYLILGLLRQVREHLSLDLSTIFSKASVALRMVLAMEVLDLLDLIAPNGLRSLLMTELNRALPALRGDDLVADGIGSLQSEPLSRAELEHICQEVASHIGSSIQNFRALDSQERISQFL